MAAAGGAGDQFRPIGWWLKEADARLEDALTARLLDHGLSRRAWQVLAGVARGTSSRTALMGELRGFDSAEELHRLISDMQGRGWLSDDHHGDLLRLTATGADLHLAAAAEVDQLRAVVAGALPAEDYQTLVGLLTRLVDAFPPIARVD